MSMAATTHQHVTPDHEAQDVLFDETAGTKVFSTWASANNSSSAVAGRGDFGEDEVELYREKWRELGFVVQVTASDKIRNDVVRLQELLEKGGRGDSGDRLLEKFDNLPNQSARVIFWSYTKLYLDGGIWSDAGVEPLPGILVYAHMANASDSSVVFEQANWPDNFLTRTLVPLISEYTEIPAYASCVLISPGKPHTPFFLDLLEGIGDLQKYSAEPEPLRTLMSVGAGHLTRFVKERRLGDVLRVGYRERRLAYLLHHRVVSSKEGSVQRERANAALIIFVACSLILLCLYRRKSTSNGAWLLWKRSVLAMPQPVKSRLMKVETEESKSLV